ncbi:hypothetical protein GZL_06341 [Streptomyces sp. 769]|nr:hypothetical protein GZL_06341 [Streptomyces sp. 769]
MFALDEILPPVAHRHPSQVALCAAAPSVRTSNPGEAADRPSRARPRVPPSWNKCEDGFSAGQGPPYPGPS